MAKTTTSTPQDAGQPGGGRIARARAAVAANEGGAKGGPPSAGSFYRESLAELRKVNWPSRQDAMNLTIAVVGMTLAMSVFLGLIDGGLDQIVTKLLGA